MFELRLKGPLFLLSCPRNTPQRKSGQEREQGKRKVFTKQRVDFDVREVSEEPQSSGWEGDEASDPDEVVNAFMNSYAVRAIRPSYPSALHTWNESDYE